MSTTQKQNKLEADTKNNLTSCNQQSHILLKQQVFDLNHELELLKIHNHNLLQEIAELKQKQEKLKHLNNIMLQNLNSKPEQVLSYINKINDEIKLKIQGQFLNNRIKELQLELEKYKNGVCDSVDRRVKKIVNEYTQQQDLQNQKRKSRISMGSNGNSSSRSPMNNAKRQSDHYETHEHKYYNIEYNNYVNSKSDSQNSDNSNNVMVNVQSINTDQEESSFVSSKRQSNEQSDRKENESLCEPYNENLVRNFSKCDKCKKLQEIIADKDEYIEKIEQRLRMFIEFNANNNNNASNVNKNGQNNNKIPIKQNTNKNQQNPQHNQQVQQWKLKYLQLLKQYENLKQEHEELIIDSQSHQTHNDDYHDISQEQFQMYTKNTDKNNKNNMELQDSQSQQFQYDTYTITHSPINPGFKRKLTYNNNSSTSPIKTNNNSNLYKTNNFAQSQSYVEQKKSDRETEMLQQITNLVNGLGINRSNNRNIKGGASYYRDSGNSNNKMIDKKSRVSQINNLSRVSTTSTNNRLDGSVFTIKEGVNRYGSNNPFF